VQPFVTNSSPDQLDWFGSGEIIIEAVIAGSALYLFLVHTFTADAPFVRPALFRDRNFAAGTLFGVIIGLTYYAAAAQEFSLLPAQNTSGNWVKVVQRIPMRVRLDTSDKNRPALRAGMSVEVDVDTGHQRGLPQFVTALFGRAHGSP
jgi:hypothetical protein